MGGGAEGRLFSTTNVLIWDFINIVGADRQGRFEKGNKDESFN